MPDASRLIVDEEPVLLSTSVSQWMDHFILIRTVMQKREKEKEKEKETKTKMKNASPGGIRK